LEYTLADLAARLGVDFRGDGRTVLRRVDTLVRADEQTLAFYAHKKYRTDLAGTRAGAVILIKEDADLCPVSTLISQNPYLAYARAARLLHPQAEPIGGCHPTAFVASSARVDPSAWVGPMSVVEDGVEIGPRVFVGPGCIVASGCRIDEDSRLVARVTLCEGTRVGKRALVHPGAVIGREGFGFAKDGERWIRIPQLGCVRIGDDVEIGANTTVDRGALEDTIVADGAKLDNLIQVGHNCYIGENTALAACSGISGSTHVGRNCTIAGAVGMAGHLEIGDNVHFTGMAMVTRSFAQPGVYSSGIPAMPNVEWRRNAARFRHLDEMARRLRRLEDALAEKMTDKPERDRD